MYGHAHGLRYPFVQSPSFDASIAFCMSIVVQRALHVWCRPLQ